jgi:hypothetical protein
VVAGSIIAAHAAAATQPASIGQMLLSTLMTTILGGGPLGGSRLAAERWRPTARRRRFVCVSDKSYADCASATLFSV